MRALKVIAVVGLVLAISGAAQGLTFNQPYNGPIKIKYQNWDVGTLYGVADGTYVGESNLDALMQFSPPNAFGSEDSWGALQVTSIIGLNGNVILWDATTADSEITGLFWGERDTFLDQTTAPGVDGILGTADDEITQNIHGVDMKLAFWEDANKDLGDPRGLDASGSLSGTARRTGISTFVGATEGTLLWTANSVPGFQPGTDEFFTTFSPTGNNIFGTFNSIGGLHADLGAIAGLGLGSANGLFAGHDTVGVDWRITFTGVADDMGVYDVLSDDPIYATVIPEPVTMLAVAMGISGLAGYIRKRRIG